MDPPGNTSGDDDHYEGQYIPPPPRISRAPPPEKPKPSRLADPFKPRLGRHLVWKDVQMTLKTKNNKKEDQEPPKVILDSVWGEVPKGQVTAIMGPSGSG